MDIGIKQWIIGRLSAPLWVKGGAFRKLKDTEKVTFFIETRMYKEAETIAEKTLPFLEVGSKEHRLLLRQFLSIHLRQAQFEPCLEKANWLLDLYPNTKEGREAKEFIADSLRYLGYFQAAHRSYDRLQSGYRNSNLGDSYRFFSFWSQLVNTRLFGHKETISSKFKVFRRDKNLTPEAPKYWQIKHLQGSIDYDAKKVASQFLTTKGDSIYSSWLLQQFPSLRSALKLNSIKLTAEPWNEWIVVDRWKNLKAKTYKISDLGEIIVLASKWHEGARYLFKKRFSRLRKQYSKRLVSEIAKNLHLYDEMYRGFEIGDLNRFGIYKSITHQNTHSDKFQKRYPKAYEQHVRKYCRFFGVDPNLVWSVMRTESHYRRYAKSAVGAIGLMQLMPYTAVKIIYQKNLGRDSMKSLWEPETNIFLGIAYLSFLEKAFSGNTYAMIASYNAGPKKVIRWLSSCRRCQSDEFVEIIPYRETRKYVKKVLKNLNRYARLYDGKIDFSHGMKLPNHLPKPNSVF